MSTAAAAAPAAPKPPKPRKPRMKKPTEFVDCERCGVSISKARYANHVLTLSCARATYNKRCAAMMRDRGYVPIQSWYDAKIWRLLPEDFRDIGPDPRAGSGKHAEVVIWVKEELGAVVNGALRAHLDEKMVYRIAHVAAADPELRAAMATLFLVSPKEAFQQNNYNYQTRTYMPNPPRDALIEGLEQWVGDWESVNLPDEVEKD